ncbi:MAG: TIGR03013 family PEP-CTERM/XrtA system glycosyltransferase [Deltaproteobacteria bacterium]|nr:TIGR03013 family PEP-CTERM/XrtA system glycosyltransferase [Candidatus Deferrimicrobium borealis]
MFSVVASFLLFHGRAGTPVVSMGDVVARAFVITIFCQACMYLLDLYNFRYSQTWGEMLFALAIAIGFVCVGIGLLSYAIPKFGVAGKMYYLSILIASVCLLLWRIIFEIYITRLAPQMNILIVGTGEVARRVGEEVRKSKRLGFHLVGFINAPPAKDTPSEGQVGEILGDSEQMDRIIEQHNVDKIVVAITERRGEYPVKEMLALRVGGHQVLEWPGFFEKLSGRIPTDSLAPSFFIFNEGFRKSMFLLWIRRVVSVIVAAVLLVLLLPVFLVVAILITLDSPGPIIYSQIRVGQKNKPIRIYKFRSMRNDAEKNGDAVWAVENDPRITRVGHFLRKTRIDELPQLFNILIGELDFVGPRPERPEFVEKLQSLIPFYALRHTVKPGLTGWAQVMFHYGSTIDESKEKLQYDLFYIKNMSLKLDLLILFHTFKIVLLGRGAR